jgi:hypothetical protein
MMFCDVDGGVINRDSWRQVRGFSRANGLEGLKSKTIVIGPFGYVTLLYIVVRFGWNPSRSVSQKFSNHRRNRLKYLTF